MSDQDEKRDPPQEQDSTPEQLAPETSPATPADEKNESTISLLDLIRETKDSDDPGVPEEDTAEIPLPLIVTLPEEDDPTVTITPDPSPQDSKPSPMPLSQQELRTPTERPLVYDPEATEVQPRVAFSRPQAGSPVEERPTEIHERGASTGVPLAAATSGSTRRSIPDQPPDQQQAPALVTGSPPSRNWGGCLGRLILFTLIAGVVVFTLAITAAAMGYTAIARTLPPPSELSARASAFETVRIYDRNGNLLYSQADPNTGNRLYVPLDEI